MTQYPGEIPIRPGRFAIDGLPNSVHGQVLWNTSCAGTTKAINPWLRVDLKNVYMISRVRAIIFGSSGQNVTVHVGNTLTNNSNDLHLCGSPRYGARYSLARAFWRDVNCTPPVWGRYIAFQRTVDRGYLEICEIVFDYGENQ